MSIRQVTGSQLHTLSVQELKQLGEQERDPEVRALLDEHIQAKAQYESAARADHVARYGNIGLERKVFRITDKETTAAGRAKGAVQILAAVFLLGSAIYGRMFKFLPKLMGEALPRIAMGAVGFWTLVRGLNNVDRPLKQDP
jgi:hypothetical protein